MFAVLRRLWNVAPPPGTPLNWEHPLVQGMVAAWVLNVPLSSENSGSFVGGCVPDLVTGSYAQPHNSTFATSCEEGVGGLFDGTTHHYSIPDHPWHNVQPPRSVACRFWVSTSAPNSFQPLVAGYQEGGTYPGYGIAVNVNVVPTSYSFGYWAGNIAGAWLESNITGLHQSRWMTGVATHDENNLARVFVHGRPDNSATVSTPGSWAGERRLGSNGSGTGVVNNCLTGRIAYALVWRRVLTPAEVMMLTDHPYGFFASPAKNTMTSMAVAAAEGQAGAYHQTIIKARWGRSY